MEQTNKDFWKFD